jgi:2-dehydro-3-deoxyphosphogluconate aldolase / (4S)-4-hydroxy-2-oxoglutarate aldolase
MTGTPFEQALLQCPVIAIIRERSPERDLVEVIEALIDGGIRAVEVTVDSPNWDVVMPRFAGRTGVAIGAGTVRTVAELDRLVTAGGCFAVSPHVEPAIIEATLARGLTPLPGAMTPTEVHQAAVAGTEYVKLFPAVTVGPQHLRALRGPFPSLQAIPTGGIGPDDLEAWFSAGAVAAGLGGLLVTGSVAEIAERSRRLVAQLALRDR